MVRQSRRQRNPCQPVTLPWPYTARFGHIPCAWFGRGALGGLCDDSLNSFTHADRIHRELVKQLVFQGVHECTNAIGQSPCFALYLDNQILMGPGSQGVSTPCNLAPVRKMSIPAVETRISGLRPPRPSISDTKRPLGVAIPSPTVRNILFCHSQTQISIHDNTKNFIFSRTLIKPFPSGSRTH